MLYKATLVFLGSGFGGLLRYALSSVIQRWWGPAFPVGTLIVNLSGCLAMGFLAAVMTGPWMVRDEYRIAILIGVLGGYTTFSSFGRETIALISDREWALAALNIVLSNLLGLLAVWAGATISGSIYGRGAS